MTAALKSLKAPLLGIFLALLVCMALLLILGESPKVLLEALQNTLLSSFGLGYSLFYATPLIFTGLSVAICFHCGLFNIGAEGQLYLGSIAIVFLSTLLPGLSPFLAIPLGILAASLAGGIWGGLVGYFKAKRGSHEVIVTILMNFLAYALVDYAVIYLFKNPDIQNPETVQVGLGYQLTPLADYLSLLGLDIFKTTPLNTAFFLAVAAAFFCQFFLFKTSFGYEMRAVGANPNASRFAGISVSKNTLLAFAIAGALAGLVGVNEVMGHAHKVIEGFSPGYGFTGIAVALMARNHPIGILFSAFLFGALQNSARELEFISDKVTREISLVLQATLIAFVACRYLFERYFKK